MSATMDADSGDLSARLQLDRQIDALSAGLDDVDDPALAALRHLAQDVDRRVAGMLEGPDLDLGGRGWPSAPPPLAHRGGRRGKPRSGRVRMRVAVLGSIGAVVLSGTGVAAAFSTSRGDALYPVHRLLLGGSPAPDPAAAAAADLARARTDIAALAGANTSDQTALLTDARRELSAAARLLAGLTGAAYGSLRADLAQVTALVAAATEPLSIAPVPPPAGLPTSDGSQSPAEDPSRDALGPGETSPPERATQPAPSPLTSPEQEPPTRPATQAPEGRASGVTPSSEPALPTASPSTGE